MAISTDSLQQQEVKLSKEEIQRYSRHLIMPEVGMEGQLKLKRARVLTIRHRRPGARRSGFIWLRRALDIWDSWISTSFTIPSNLQRQVTFTTS